METCQNCWKDKQLCVCGNLPIFDNKVRVVILQHPQEPDKELGSARLANLILRNSVLKTGLSIANLKKVAGPDADPARWIVLFLGSKYKFREIERREGTSDLYLFDRKGEEVNFPLQTIEGIIAIDGTWAQAKALWWRNPWLLKLKRAVLDPRKTSLYGNLRKEPRRECISTIESIAFTLEVLGEEAAVSQALFDAFASLVNRCREVRKAERAKPQKIELEQQQSQIVE